MHMCPPTVVLVGRRSLQGPVRKRWDDEHVQLQILIRVLQGSGSVGQGRSGRLRLTVQNYPPAARTGNKYPPLLQPLTCRPNSSGKVSIISTYPHSPAVTPSSHL